MAHLIALDIETFPVAGVFTISRGSRTEAVVVSVTLSSEGYAGRGECTPYARYGETADSVCASIRNAVDALSPGLDRELLQSVLSAGAARNALDCALWDLEAKKSGVPAYRSAGLTELLPVTTAYTLSIASVDDMGRAAEKARDRPLLKVKLGADGVAERLNAVRRGAPSARLIVDANEAWRTDTLVMHLDACAAFGVEVVEQPLPADDDGALEGLSHAISICADESAHDRSSLTGLERRYNAINIKLDKTGGLTEALAMTDAARAMGLDIMVGCMLGSSLAMAPAMILAQSARWVDLDAPLLLAKDRVPGLVYEHSLASPPEAALWG